ncbi:MAG: metallophosphoesterase, partial [Polyangiaceae bacterium]
MRVMPTAIVAIAFLLGCDRKVPENGSAAVPERPAPAKSIAPADTRRIVAIGDLHGDLDHARRALRLAGAIDASDAWIGGKLVVVQTGDEIDRGDDDRTILDLVDKLKIEAKTAGGELVALLGNHEIMNAQGDFRYVTPAGSEAFSLFGGRGAAFKPGGRYATLLSQRPVVSTVGSTIFVHGGILPKHVAYGLDKMNAEVDA